MKALYRKYRPKTLAEVIGQERVTSVLENSIAQGKISHAYLFTGPRGTGKTSVARIFAHEINHFPYELEDSYVDIIEIDGASNRGIDNIRELREKAAIAPTKGKYKIYIIDEVHMLTKEAFNALLKTLEEPPAHVIFILATTDLQKVPVTITSRVQILVFNLASPDVMKAHLKSVCSAESLAIDDDALDIIVRRGGGSFRDSLSLLGQIATLKKDDKKITKSLIESSLGLPQDELITTLLAAYESSDLETISSTLKTILGSGTKPETLAEEIINRLLLSPSPSLLPLLQKLPEVRAPFPEAKLLLAFVNLNQPAPSAPTIKNFSIAPKKNPVDFHPKPAETPPEITPNSAVSTEEIQPNSADFSWENYLNSVQSTSVGAAMWLKKCRFSLENGCLELFPPTSTTKGILESENNLKVLKSCLKNFDLRIHNPDDFSPNPAKKDPKFTKIDDIMGKTQEVNNGGEIPF
ncbi:DNA polymerase III subunit gamma/tau [Candidatus Saccharibacteria bacterium]|nr:DNA polymerase III subunit gamma/tau [Candidatus Saccharibacteria bacterium]